MYNHGTCTVYSFFALRVLKFCDTYTVHYFQERYYLPSQSAQYHVHLCHSHGNTVSAHALYPVCTVLPVSLYVREVLYAHSL